MTSSFYRAFEEKYRGPRELIKSRLCVYLPFVHPLKELRRDCRAIDLGCGRGEWLELLREAGVDSHGVDLDEGMLAACREIHLSAAHGDAISTLKEMPDESRDIVSGFHLVEHMPFSDVQVLVQEAMRVLRPAGLLILETPNPENIAVGTSSFYLDPTHHRPLPPGLLAFLPEYCGFYRVKIVRLQEPAGLVESASPTLMNVLSDSSTDYAVVCQKESTVEHMAGFDAAFARSYGLTVAVLAANYDAGLDARIRRAEAISREALAQLQGVLESRSWRMTAPLRTIAGMIRRLLG